MRRLGCLLLAAVAMPTANAYARWHLTDLGTLGGAFSRATAINGAGQIAGFSVPKGAPTTVHHCFVWSHGSLRDIGTLPGTDDCRPSGIDDAGDVAGTSGSHAFFWHDGNYTDLGDGEAVGMNAGGSVLVDAAAAFVWHDGVKTPLESPRAAWVSLEPIRILANGDVIGSVYTSSGKRSSFPASRAVVWHDGKLDYLPMLKGATESDPWWSNESGVVVGAEYFPTHPYLTSKAVVWKDGTVAAVEAPDRGEAQAISGIGEIGVLTTSGAGMSLAAQSYVSTNGKLMAIGHGGLDFSCANHHLLAGQGHHAFVWMTGKFTWLPARASAVNACNEHDQLVGWTTVKGRKIAGTQPVHAALWSH